MIGQREPVVDGAFVEMRTEGEAQLPAVMSIDRLAGMSPEIDGHEASDGPLIDALAALPEGARSAAVLRLAQRQAAVSAAVSAHENRGKRGLLRDAMLSHYWHSMGGVKRVIAIKEGKRFGVLPVIERVEVWECRDNRWVGYAWQGRKRMDIPESYPADYPLHEVLRGYEIIQGVQRGDAAAPMLDARLTNADHALHDLQCAGRGVSSYRGFLKALNGHSDKRKAEVLADQEKAKLALEGRVEKRSRWRFIGLSFGVPLGIILLIMGIF